MEFYFQTENGPMLWGRRQFDSLLSELIEARRYVEFDHQESVAKVIDVVTTIMTSIHRHNYHKDFFMMQLELLQDRHDLFKYVLEFPYVNHDEETNTMQPLPYRVRAAILHEKPSAEHYLESGDPLWPELRFLFDDPEVWENDPRIVQPEGENGMYIIPNFFAIQNVDLFTRMREREYKKIYNMRWSA